MRHPELLFIPRGSVFVIKKTLAPDIRWKEYGILDNNLIILLEYNKMYYKLFSSKTSSIVFWHISFINFFYYFKPLNS